MSCIRHLYNTSYKGNNKGTFFQCIFNKVSHSLLLKLFSFECKLFLFSLREVELFGCFNLTSKTATALANHCKGLTTLNVGQLWKLSDTNIAQLSGSLGLIETLNVSGCKQVSISLRFLLKLLKILKNIFQCIN